MYPWLLFLHVGATLLFMLAHGIHVVIMLRWRQAEDPEFGLTLFNGLPGAGATRILLAAVIVTGLILAVLGDWWQEIWVWLSLGILAVMWLAMYRMGGGYFGLVQAAALAAIEEARDQPGSTVARDAYRATRLGTQPMAMMVVGIGGLAAVLWLMIFKPF